MENEREMVVRIGVAGLPRRGAPRNDVEAMGGQILRLRSG